MGGLAADARTSIPWLSAAMKGARKKCHPALTMGPCTWGLTLWGWAAVPSRTGGWGPARQCCRGCVPARGVGPSSRFTSGNPASTSLLSGTRGGAGVPCTAPVLPHASPPQQEGDPKCSHRARQAARAACGCDLTHSRAT